MAKKKPPVVDWPTRLKALQKRLGLSNTEMSERLDITLRTWLAWKYGERAPQTGSITLIKLVEKGLA